MPSFRELALSATLLPIYIGCRGTARLLGAVESFMVR
jgi:hypothetical protein